MKNKKASSVSLEITADHQRSRHGMEVVLHAVLRYLILLTSVIGAGTSVSGMIFSEADAVTVVLSSVYTFTVFYLLFMSLRGMIAGIAVGVGGMLVSLLLLRLSLKELFVGGFNGIFNSILTLIRKRGYETIPYLDSANTTDFGMLVIITAIAAVTVGISCRKRTRVVPYIVVVTVPALIFMLTGGNVHLRDFAPAIAAACAMAAMEISEKGVKEVIPSSFIGFTSFVLASVLMLTPIVNTGRSMKPISFDKIVDKLPDAVVNDVRRSAAARRGIFTGKYIMTVYTDVVAPIYMRNWAGGYYGNQSWYSVDYDYGYVGGEFARENDSFYITERFLVYAVSHGYRLSDLGISATVVRTDLATRQKNLPIPSISGRIDVLYGDRKTLDVSYIYDGVASVGSPSKGKMWSKAVVFERESTALADVIYEYNRYLEDRGSSDVYDTYLSALYFDGFAKSAYGADINDKAIDRAVGELFENTDISVYFDKSYRAEGLADLVTSGVVYDGYYYKLSDYGRAHVREVAKIVSDYLALGRKYSTDPKVTGKSVTEELLFGSKQGYCVQFATVGTLIMRRLGYYARYAEGYLIQDLDAANGELKYKGDATDNNGHAWCEVWADGFGWMTCEMTPGYGKATLGSVTPPPDTTPSPDTSRAPITAPPDTTPSPDTSEAPITTPPDTGVDAPVTTHENTNGQKGGRYRSPAPFIVASAITVLLVAALLSVVVSRALRNKKRLDTLINRALSANHNTEERRIVSASLEKALSSAIGAYGVLPRDGELPEEYGARLEETLELTGLAVPLSLCVEALIKQVYGFGMDENDIKISAFTLSALRSNALRELGVFRFVIYRIKGVL